MKSELSGDFVISGVTSCCGCCGSACKARSWIFRRSLIALLARHGVELILHGHDHVHSTIWIDGPERKIPTVGVPSASSIAHGHYPAAAYNIFASSRAGNHWRCDMTVRSVNDALRVREIRQVRLL